MKHRVKPTPRSTKPCTGLSGKG